MALKQMSFAASARLGSKLYGAKEFRLELYDHDRRHGKMLARFVVDQAQQPSPASGPTPDGEAWFLRRTGLWRSGAGDTGWLESSLLN